VPSGWVPSATARFWWSVDRECPIQIPYVSFDSQNFMQPKPHKRQCYMCNT